MAASITRTAILKLIEQDGRKENCAAHEVLVKGIDVQKIHDVLDRAHDEYADYNS
jgi:hypothetical protein